jgi:hypothetical protein
VFLPPGYFTSDFLWNPTFKKEKGKKQKDKKATHEEKKTEKINNVKI